MEHSTMCDSKTNLNDMMFELYNGESITDMTKVAALYPFCVIQVLYKELALWKQAIE